MEGELVVTKVDTKSNLADMFTKVLDCVPFEYLRQQTMNLFVRAVTACIPRARRSIVGAVVRLLSNYGGVFAGMADSTYGRTNVESIGREYERGRDAVCNVPYVRVARRPSGS